MIIEPSYYFEDTIDISPEFLKNIGVKVALVDIDNTLVTYGEAVPNEKVLDWINKFRNANIDICLISNNTTSRVSTFAKGINLKYIANATKPFAFCINKALKLYSVTKDEIILIGDQVFTDILCANIAKIKSILVKPLPYIENLFFKFKRGNEKPIIDRFKQNNPDKCFYKKENTNDN